MTDKPTQPEESKADKSEVPAEGAAEAQQEPAKESAAATPESSTAKAEEPAASKAKPRKARPAKTRRGGWGLFFLTLLLLAGLGALGYYQWMNQQDLEAAMAELNEQLEGQVDQLSQVSREARQAEQEASRAVEQVSQAAEERQQQARQFQQQANQFQDQLQQQFEQRSRELQGQLSTLRQQIQAITTTTTDDWKLAEAYYLTRLAGQRLLMERDTESALALLQSADRIVRNYPDPNLYPVRQALAEDIAELKLTDSVDREGIYLQIAALARQITELQIAEPRNFEPTEDVDLPAAEPDAEPLTEESSSWWQSIERSFDSALARLKDYIRVTPHDEPVEPLMAPDQQLQLRSSVQTALDTAQLALLREQSAIYQTSLEKAQELIARYYVDSDDRASLLADLEEMENITISQELPNITASQEALGSYLDQRHRLAPDREGGGAETDSGAN